MIGALRAEFIKFRSLRSTWSSFAGIAVIALLGAFLGDTPVTALQQYERLGIIYLAARIAVAVFAVMLVTGEFRNGVIQTSALAVPRRWTFHIAKMIMVGIYGALLSVVGCGIAVLGMWIRSGEMNLPLVSASDDSFSMFSSGSSMAQPVIYLVIVMIGFALFSGAIALALRSQPFAIVVAAIGPILSVGFLQKRWNPFVNAEAMVQPDGIRIDGEFIERSTAFMWFYGFVLLLVILAGIVHSRRDI